MDLDNEVVAYLQTLIDHYQDCARPGCPECDVVRGACYYLRTRIFASILPSTASREVTEADGYVSFAPKAPHSVP